MEAAMDKTRQQLEETALERKSRTQSGFLDFEKSLPIVGTITGIPLIDRLSSYLTLAGLRNPFSSNVDGAKETVWLLDNTAYRPVHVYAHKSQPWQAEFLVAYFKRNTGRDVSKIVASIAEKIGLGKDGADEELVKKVIAQRLQPFVDAIAPARSVKVALPHDVVHQLGPAGPSAVSVQIVTNLGEHKDGESINISALPKEASPHGAMTTHFAAPEGWAVISDIDDTIKVTMTPSPIGILRSTFASEPTPVTSMPELYTHIARTLSPTWFYLSASPYNLYPFLRSFLHQHYPPGPIFLRQASWMDLGGFLASLTQGTEAYKRSRIEKIHMWLPKRKVICIGDSTQTDPEAYGDICRKCKGWVKAVFIRKVTDVAEMKDSGKNDDERFEKAFNGVPRDIWRTFEDPAELSEAIDQLQSTK